MARPPPAPRPPASPDVRFRSQIEAALQAGARPADMTLRLSLRDAVLLARDPKIPVADIRYADGVMHFLGVRVESGGINESRLDRLEG